MQNSHIASDYDKVQRISVDALLSSMAEQIESLEDISNYLEKELDAAKDDVIYLSDQVTVLTRENDVLSRELEELKVENSRLTTYSSPNRPSDFFQKW